MTSGKIIVAFDLYGTLLSTSSIAEELSKHFGKEKAQSIATLWRRYQLEYTWRLNSMNDYEPFSQITERSLGHALAEAGEELDATTTNSLMKAYDSLSTFPDVQPALKELTKHENITPVIFSNGTDSMVSNSVQRSPDLSPHASIFAQLITVEEVKKFKPAPEVYFHLAEKMGKDRSSAEDMASMWLVSGNPFDVVGGRSVGMNAAWVDRGRQGWTDRLVGGEKGRPTVVIDDLRQVVDAIVKHMS
ncbi:hypothetical protein MMC25_005068 [Agyrium rufum]|nr:hypothetical protein [Agyrium rufum]